MKKLQQSIQPGTYQNLWCAGQSVELIDDILPCKHIIDQLKQETMVAYHALYEKTG
jgi:nitronate monooxygenase